MTSPRFESGKTLLLAGLAGRYSAANRGWIPALWMQWGPAWFGRTPGQVDGRCYGVCWNFDGKGGLDYLAGVEVSGFAALPDDLTQLTIAPQLYAIFAHGAHISRIGETWLDIYEDWQPESGYRILDTPSFELYDEDFDPDTAIGHVEIWVPIGASGD